jgi:hypothetical protein
MVNLWDGVITTKRVRKQILKSNAKMETIAHLLIGLIQSMQVVKGVNNGKKIF